MRSLIGILALAGCASVGPTAERPCYVAPAAWNMDDQNPVVRMTVLNVGRACGVGLSVDRRAPERVGSIIEQPSHGTARVRRVAGVMRAEYTPAAGFVGSDSYRAQLGPVSQSITVQVSVRAPPGA